MQYILTQDEYNELEPKDEVTKRDMALDAARKFILLKSDFTCIEENPQNRCDKCPITLMNGETFHLVCQLPKKFSR
jgi:hypothetical protein